MRTIKLKLPLRLNFLLLAMVIYPLALAEPPADDSAKPPPVTGPTPQVSTPHQTPKTATPVPPGQRPSKPGPPAKQAGFTPTEKIAADVAVSFPVDI